MKVFRFHKKIVKLSNIIFIISIIIVHVIVAIESTTIKSIETSCETDRFNISVQFNGRFKGIIYAKNFRDNEQCRSNGSTLLSFPFKYCGLSSRLDAKFIQNYSLPIVIQFDRKLQQAHDITTLVSCIISNDNNNSMPPITSSLLKRRTGRVLLDPNPVLSNGKVWMEFTTDKNKRTIEVGDSVKMTINAILPGIYDWKITSCEASDGTKEVSQSLTDLKGCPVDATIMPKLTKVNINETKETSFRHQQAFAKFVAFKFPDRDTLNVVCRLEICNQNCSNINCNENHNRSAKSDRDFIDSMEIFNSIDVLAPGIEIEQFLAKKSSKLFENGDHSEQICISSIKLAMAFSVLGLLFLTALIVSIFCLIRSNRSSNHSTTYTRSSATFVTSTSSDCSQNRFMNQFLTNSSPRSSSRWSYGRIF